jgi:hypothetical protein
MQAVLGSGFTEASDRSRSDNYNSWDHHLFVWKRRAVLNTAPKHKCRCGFSVASKKPPVVARYQDCPDLRLKQIMESLVRHLHSFVRDVELTEADWLKGVEFLTAVGQFSTAVRQEFIGLSDVLGLKTTLVELNHSTAAG